MLPIKFVMDFFTKKSRKVLFQAANSYVPRLYFILLGISGSQLIGSLTMKSVCLKLKCDLLESQLN